MRIWSDMARMRAGGNRLHGFDRQRKLDVKTGTDGARVGTETLHHSNLPAPITA